LTDNTVIDSYTSNVCFLFKLMHNTGLSVLILLHLLMVEALLVFDELKRKSYT